MEAKSHKSKNNELHIIDIKSENINKNINAYKQIFSLYNNGIPIWENENC